MSARNDEPNLSRKDRGAYYTARTAAAALCGWALRHGAEDVLDPSAGDGVFLAAAADRLASLGGEPDQIHGVELDGSAHALARERAAAAGIPPTNVERADFFARDHGARYDAVIGNPPFIRFQRFKGVVRQRALERAAAAGVELSPLSSSWAPFVVHAAAALRTGGRLALLVPHEIAQARYGREVLEFLARTFERVTLVAPTERLFPGLDQDVLALLAAGSGRAGHDLRFAVVDDVSELGAVEAAATRIDLSALVGGTRLRFWELSPDARGAYEEVASHPEVRELRSLAHVSSGYVTGANAFFHLSPADVDRLGIESADLVPAVFRAAALGGPFFGATDWEAAVATGTAGYLFQPSEPLGDAAGSYLEHGRALGIDRGYKTRTRAVWHRVPRVQRPDLLLAAMAADHHALAVNRARAAPANTLHAVGLHDAAADRRGADERALALAVAWLTSAAWLSRELEGRVLGGGMLKLEPGEAGRILVPWPARWPADEVQADARRVERCLVEDGVDAARERADALVLRERIGLSQGQIDALAAATLALRGRRRRRPAR